MRRCYSEVLDDEAKSSITTWVGGQLPTTPAQARGDSLGQFERDASGSRQAVPGSRTFCLRLLPGRRGASVKREAANCAFELAYGRMFERRVGLAQLVVSSAVLAAAA
jgi:hypothetical protein